MSMPEADAQLPLKKRARRRLVGAVAMAVFAAVVLPMVMDPTPQAPVADVEIRIPGQDQAPAFNPKALAAKPAEAPAAKAAPEKAVDKPAEAVAEKVVDKAAEKPADKATAKVAEKPADKPAVPARAPEKPAEKAVDKAAEKPADKSAADKAKAGGDDSRRAAAILAGKTPDAPPAAAAEQHVILIGAFANQANVKQLQTKLGELGIKVYTEALDSPQGKKTRVRAGPFASRDAADKALERMKRIGVNGVVAVKQ